MSLILDALKKSEAERQLGRAPGLMSPMVRVSRRRSLSPWWGVLGLALAAGGFAAWWVATQRETPTPVPPEVVEEAPRAAAPAAARPASEAARVPSPAATPAATSARPQGPALTAVPEPAQPTESDALLPRDPQFDSVERESVPVPAEPAPVPSATTSRARAAESAPSPAPPTAAATLPPPVTGPSSTPTLPPAPATASSPETAATEAASTAQPSHSDEASSLPIEAAASPPPAEPPLEQLPLVSELMPDVRNTLPPLKLSMHVFNAVPASRFVLIDGKRYVEGERVAGSLRVEAIRRDGAVLDFDGKRFLVPRP